MVSFLDLVLELRLEIYDLSFISPEVIYPFFLRF